MKLTKIAVENFGKLQNFTMNPTDGINVFHEENGWGKTTLAVFLKAMLYGLPASTKRSLDENERKKYAPWQGGSFGGSLEFSTEKGNFRVERFFGAKESDDTFALYDLSTNLLSNAYSERLGEELFGIDADGFERTCYLSQRLLADGAGKESVSAKLGGLLDASDDPETFEKAMNALEKRRKYYKSGNNSYLPTLEKTLSESRRELEQCRLSEDAMQAQIEQEKAAQTERDAVRKTLAETHEKLRLAGLARERTALAEQKSRMEAECTAMKRALEAELAEFCGKLPPSEQFEAAKRDFEERKQAEIALQTSKSVSAGQTEPDELLKMFPTGAPDGEEINHALAENRELVALSAKKRAEESSLASEPDVRFDLSLGEKITQAKAALANLSKMRETLTESAPKSKLFPLVFAWISFAAAIGCVLASVFRNPMQPLVLIPSCLFAAVGIFSLAAYGKAKKRLAQADEIRRKTEETMRPVRELFRAAGVAEPADYAVGLELLAERQRAAQRVEKVKREKRFALSETEKKVAEKSKSLYCYLHQFFGDLPEKEDYADEIFALQRAAERKRALESSSKLGSEQIAKMREKIDFLNSKIHAFLAEYCPTSKTEAAFFANASAHRSEILRLQKSISEKGAEIDAFVAEKLPELPKDLEKPDFEAVAADEKALRGKEEELQQRIARLRSSIDRLSQDADRIPDLVQRISGLEESFAEANHHYETVVKVAEYLQKAKDAMTARYLGGMQESLSEYLNALMGDGSADAGMNTKLEVQLREMGKNRSMESFSRGWRDAVDFCLRLSLTKALCNGSETPFLLLDDPFVNFDDRRNAAALGLLDRLKNDYQILYFKCREG